MANTISHRIQIFLLALVALCVLGYGYFQIEGEGIKQFFQPSVPIMKIDDVPLRVEIANSDAERVKGLSDREEFTTADGLLFVFPTPGYYSIWMKDMHFPIDIIWIGADLKIIEIHKGVTPDSYPRLYRPSRPAQYVLETNIHLSDTFSFKEGDTVVLPPQYLED